MRRKSKRHKLHALQFAAQASGKNFRMISACAWDPIEAEAQDGTKLKRFSMTAYTGGTINVGFGLPLVVDLAGLTVLSQSVPILRGHDSDKIAGHSEKIDVTTQRIYVGGLLSGSADIVAEIRDTARNGFPWQASIGATIDKNLDYVDRGESVKVNGKNFDGPLFVARKTTLAEVSFVPVGADMHTSANVAASHRGRIMGFEAWLKANGFDSATLNDTQRAFFKAMYEAEMEEIPAPTPVPAPAPINAAAEAEAVVQRTRQAIAAEETRIAAIRAICRVNPDLLTEIEASGVKTKVTIQAHAIADNWDERRTRDRYELETIRAERAAPVFPIHGQERDCTLEALQGAMLLRAGAQLDNRAFNQPQAIAMGVPSWLRASINADARQKAMESAHQFRSLSMVDLAAECLRLDGKAVPRDREKMIRAAFSGGSLTNIFTTNVNTMVLVGYMQTGDTTDVWTKTVDVNDFKTNERPRMTTGPNLERLPRGGEAKHASRSDVGETYKIARYAEQWQIDEQDMIDDMFNALSDLPTEFGKAAMRLRPDLVYSLLLANPTVTATARALFNATDGNLGAASALSAATLKAAISAMLLLQENAVNISLQPTHLIVPQTLRWTAKELLNSTMIVIAGTAGSVTERGNINTLENEVQLVSESRIENGLTDPATAIAYTGSSSTWFMASTEANTIEVGYLRGTGRVPRIRGFVLDKGKFGLGWDISLDIGAKAMDWRGMRKTTA